MTPEEIAAWEPFLKRVPLFAGLSTADLQRVAVRLQPLSLPKGSTLFSAGEEPNAFYIITSGQVRITHKIGGVETVEAFLGRGEEIGEGGLLTGEPRTTTVRLDTTCEFLKLLRKDFEDVLRENPPILLHLSRVMAKRLVEQRSGPAAGKAKNDAYQLIGLAAALPRGERQLLTVHLALQLVEQVRRRVLLVDLHADSGMMARILGLKPQLVTEEALRGVDLRDPSVIQALSQQHPCGLDVLSIPAATLGGRLYSGIYLFLNFLREAHEFSLVAMDTDGGDVEKAIIAEADLVLLAGQEGHRPQFRQLQAELRSLVAERKRLLQVWLGELDAEAAVLDPGLDHILLPWPESIGEQFERAGNPYEVMQANPKSQRSIERLARKLGGVKLGLAFGTGAALGHSLIGVLKVFKRENLPIDIIAGTSIGSLVAGLVALGMEPEEIEELALRVDKGWVYENLFLDLTVPRSGFFAGATLLRFLRSYFGAKEFSDLELPFACVATDIETGEEVVLREGRVAEAIRASCGLPLIFSPIRLNGRYLVDGGLVNPVPTNVVGAMGADVIVAVNLTMPASERATRRKPAPRGPARSLLNTPMDLHHLKELALPDSLKAPDMFSVFFQMIYTMEYEIAQARMDLAHVVIEPDLKGFSWTDLHRAKEIIKAGERIAEEYVPQIKALLPFYSNYCKVPQRPSSRLSF
jgi:NTE family protein